MAEDRELEELGLGEIQSPAFEMKGDRYPDEDLFFYEGIPADLQGTVPLADIPQVNEDRTQSATVKSTFDTRPINATDFHYTNTTQATPDPDNDVSVDFSYVVPKGYVAVLRGYQYTQYPYALSFYTPLVSIIIRGALQLGNSNNQFEADTMPVDTHIIAPENSTLIMRVTFPAGYSYAVDYWVWGHLYGNLILSTNQPPAFEVGNAVKAQPMPIPKDLIAPQKPPVTAQKSFVPSQPIRRMYSGYMAPSPKSSVQSPVRPAGGGVEVGGGVPKGALTGSQRRRLREKK